ncbi:MAG TPA: GH25 family lysozyme [Oscillospiraceae bacterium]|jgi:hypothetical protein|nr:GH25 family lysozyme [Oscillospiraceae bacterium]
MSTKIVDVSRWNNTVDYKALKKKGITGVVIQCGYGMVSSQKDLYFESNYKKARANKMLVGVYHYSYAKSVAEAKEEAKVCLGWLKGRSLDMPIYIDMEEENLTYLGKSTLTKIAKEFCKTIEKAGYKAGVYANANWFKNNLNYSSLKKNHSIWLAQYSSTKDYDCDIWQYTSKYIVNGNTFDCNICYKSFGKTMITTKLKCPVYNKHFIDKVGNASRVLFTVPKGTKVQWLKDMGDGWSQVRYNGKTGYMVNTRLNKSGISKYKTIVVGKGSTYKRVVKGKIKYTKQLDKDREFRIICYITEGKYKGYYYMYRNLKYYLVR